MSNRFKGIIAVVLAVILILVIILTPLRTVLANFGGMIFTPICNFFGSIGSSVSDWFSKMGQSGDVYQTNKELTLQIDKLNNKLKTYETLEEENKRLKSLLELKQSYSEIESVGAEIIAKDAGNWFNGFTIDKGTSDGVNKNQPVICGGGIVGHTTEAGYNFSKVISLIDTSHSVSGMSLRSGDYVQVDGDLALMEKGLCKMTNITDNADVIVGDVIVTSGMGGVYPKGITIGTVQEFKTETGGTGSYAVIKPAVNFEKLNELLVLKTKTEE